MFGSDVLEIAIGTIFVILIVSLLASSIRELIESILKSRAVQLERGLRNLLDDPTGKTALKELFDHPMMSGLFKGEYNPDSLRNRFWPNLPSYIPSRNFALGLLHSVAGSGSDSTELNVEAVRANAMALPEGRIRQAILVAVAEAENDLERARASVEAWFDSNMDRVSGWYKRKTQLILLIIGLILAIALNVDSVGVVRELSTNTVTRQRVIADVNAYTAATANLPQPQRDELKKEIQGLSGVIGWTTLRNTERQALEKQAAADPKLPDADAKAKWVEDQMPSWRVTLWDGVSATAILGWVLTAIAVSLGAPFWFDLLNKFMVVRATVKPYEKSPSEGTEDRKGAPSAAQQLAAQPTVTIVQGGVAQQQQLAQAQPVLTAVRAAIDLTKLTPGTIKLEKNGINVDVPPDGFVELELEPDAFHNITATATRTDGKAFTWSMNRYFTVDDEARPITIE